MGKSNTSVVEVNKAIPKKKTELVSKSKLDDIDALFASKKAKKKEETVASDKKMKLSQNRKKSLNSNHPNAHKKNLQGDRSDIDCMKNGEWVDDGLGGIFDKDGFTGRREQGSGFKIYKAHLMNKKGFGQTKDCPFDCDCCYI